MMRRTFVRLYKKTGENKMNKHDTELISFVKSTSLHDVVDTIKGCGNINNATQKMVERFGISQKNAVRVLNADWKI